MSGRRIDVKGEDPEDETRSSRDEADASAERAQRAPARDPLAGGERSDLTTGRIDAAP